MLPKEPPIAPLLSIWNLAFKQGGIQLQKQWYEMYNDIKQKSGGNRSIVQLEL